MEKEKILAVIAIPIVVIIAAGLAWAGSQNSILVYGLPLFAVSVAAAFLIQWLAFLAAFIWQTEKYFDLMGSLTYISIIIFTAVVSGSSDFRSILLTVMVLIWAVRLGTFLFRRIRKAGKDGRFDELKPDFFKFWNVWNLQGLWVSFTSSAAWIAIASSRKVDFGIFAIIGTIIWLFGFGFEVIADLQKSKFLADPTNKGKFINVGLWSKSRHPNYFGEITLWTGIAIITFPVLQGWQLIGLISPIFVAILLTRISGVPILEKRGDEKWGDEQDYQEYKKNTPVLIPKL
jgi:steroid 5-alpha reductase family enzyme